ncbi:MAG: glycosyltransferase family 2 protein [bacterium]
MSSDYVQMHMDAAGCRVSVLTPVHLTDFPLFKRAFQSLKDQTFGFSGIEWIVVLHNCSQEYAREAKELLAEYPNIRCQELKAEGTGVSFARNTTLSLARGEYVFFLDADDEMLPECIEKVVREMDRSKSDTAIFTAQVINTKPGSEDQKNTLLWTDALPGPEGGALILDKGDPRIGKSMCVSGKVLWTRCYRRDFLLREQITFNEAFERGEDFLFNIGATGAAKRVLVLPSICGYRYYVGMGMMERILHESTKTLSNDFSGNSGEKAGVFYTRLFRYGRICGLDLTNLIWKEMADMGRWFLFSDIPRQIKESYVNSIRPLAGILSPPAMECPGRQDELMEGYRFVKAITVGGII